MDGLSPYQIAWAKADEEVQANLKYYMAKHDVEERLYVISDIILFGKGTLEERYEALKTHIVDWFEFEVDKRAEEIHG